MTRIVSPRISPFVWRASQARVYRGARAGVRVNGVAPLPPDRNAGRRVDNHGRAEGAAGDQER